MSATITINHPSFDRIYSVYAWRNNNIGLGLVQGEGVTIPDEATTVVVDRAKAPRFLLRDEREVIDLSGENTYITWAVTLPCGGGEELIECNIIQPATQGVIEIPITTSITTYHGMAYGEIRVATDSGTIKFSGINAKIACGVSDDAIEHSSRFSGLISALQKVVTIDTDRVAQMDSLDEYGDLPTYGTNPVASGALKQYLQGKYINDIEQSRGYVNENEMNDAIAEAIRGIATFGFSIVSELPPVSDAYTNKIYLVPNDSTSQDPVYDQWVVIDNEWVYLGSTQVDISNKADKATTLAGYGITDAYTKAEVNRFVNSIPTKTSQLTNDSGFLTSHQDISGKADKATSLAGYGITDAYTKAQVDEAIPETVNDLNDGNLYVRKYEGSSEPPSSPVTNQYPVPCLWYYEGDVWFLYDIEIISGSGAPRYQYYFDKLIPVVPSKTSDLTNDSGFLTAQDISGKMDLAPIRATIDDDTQIKQGQLIVVNDEVWLKHKAYGAAGHKTLAEKSTTLAGYGITDAYTKNQVNGLIPTVPSNVSAFTNDAGYLTQHQDVSGKMDLVNPTSVSSDHSVKKGQIAVVSNEIILKTANIGESGHKTLAEKADIPTVPSNVSAFNNDAGYLTAHQDISGKEDTSNKVTSIDMSADNTHYPSAMAVKEYVDSAAAEGFDYVFVNEIPADADTAKKYVLPDGYIYEYQEGTPAVIHNANTKIINQKPETSANYETLSTQAGVLTSDLIPFSSDWTASGEAVRAKSKIKVSGISKVVPAYYNSSIIVYYYKHDGTYISAARSSQLTSLNVSLGSEIALPREWAIKDTSAPAVTSWAQVGYIRVLLGISTAGDITENDIKDVIINVPYYDTPAIPGGWVSTGTKHPYYTTADEIFNEKTNQILYAVGDSITYGYGVGGNNYSWVKHVIDRLGYDAANSKNLGESGLGFCTTSTSSHTITDVVGGTDFSTADVVTVALGINDWKNANALLTDFWSGMEYCFNKIRTDNPYCKIYYILPFNASFGTSQYSSFYCLGWKGDSNTARPYGHTLQDFINMIKAKFEEATFKAFHVEVIDMTECPAINRQNITTALLDNLHPTVETHIELGKEIARRIVLM